MAASRGQVASVGLVRLDGAGRCLYVNERVCRMVGFSRKAILGRSWLERTPAPTAARLPELWAELRAGRSVSSVLSHARPDGRRVSLQFEAMPELGADGRVASILVACLDVTPDADADAETREARQQAFARLEELEELYHRTPVGLCAVDRELRYVRANDAYARTVGYAIDELIGRSMREVIPESAREDAVAMAKRVIETGEPVRNLELRRLVPDDPCLERIWLVNIHPVKRDGAVSGAMAVFQDVTSVRRAEEAARARLSELESIYRNAPVGLSFVDRDLRYLRVNQAIADMNGVRIEEMVGRTYRDLSPETADAAEPFLRALMDRDAPVHNLEVRSRPPSDRDATHVYLLSMEPVRSAQGELLGYTSAVQDVTELRRAEDTAASRLEELEILYASTPAGLCYLDAGLRIVHLNPLFAQLIGRAPDQLIGAAAPDVLSGRLAGRILPQLRYVARTGASSVDLEIRGQLPGGDPREYTWVVRVHPVKARSGELIGIVTVWKDVTAMAERQREVESVRDRLAEAQRVARVGSWEWDLIEDRVWWSGELYEIFGVDPSKEPSYTSFFEHVHPADRPKVRDQIERTLEDDQPYRLTFRIVRGDGAERLLFTAARLERTPDGLAARLVGTCQDVTEFGPGATGAPDEHEPAGPGPG